MAMFFGLVNISFASSDNNLPECCKKKGACCTEGAACCAEAKTQKSSTCCSQELSCCEEGASCCANKKGAKIGKRSNKKASAKAPFDLSENK